MFFTDRRSLLLWLALAVAVLLLPVDSTSQTGDTTDVVRQDTVERSPYDDFSIDSLDPEDFDFESGIIPRTSTGWFPTPSPGASISLYGPFIYSQNFDRADGLTSDFVVPTAEPFTDVDPYDCGFFEYLFDDAGIGDYVGGCSERRILLPGSDETTEDGYPIRGFGDVGLRFNYHLPLPLMLRASARYRRVEGLLFSEDTSRAYLSYDGSLRPFREIGVLAYDQHAISGSVGLQIPVYGAFITSDLLTIGSYYYLFGEYSADYALANSVVQYTQIADVKDQIRYENGQDTATLMRRNNPDGFDRFRESIEVGAGWNLVAEVVTIGFEAFASIPMRSILTDAEWREYYAGVRISLGYVWGTGTTWR